MQPTNALGAAGDPRHAKQFLVSTIFTKEQPESDLRVFAWARFHMLT